MFGIFKNKGPEGRQLPMVSFLALSWAVLAIVPLFTRTFMPVDETRYVSVAWDMWLRGDFLVPHLNGQPYSDKPPLLFWLINLGWALAGVSDIWPRLVSPLFGAANLLLTSLIARKLWPANDQAGWMAPLITLGSGIWMIFMAALMFDMMLLLFVLLAVLGIIRCWQDSDWKGWLLAGIAIGFGILSKGPVILVHTLPMALLAPWWMVERRPQRWIPWYFGVLGSVLIGAVIALSWAVPAAIAGGENYARAIFWGQSAGRMAKAFAHERAIWWYLPFLPLLLFPWSAWPPLWRSFRLMFKAPPSSAVRLCVAWGLPAFIIFSLISGKQVHYLLPLVPVFGLLGSYALDKFPSFRAYDVAVPLLVILIVGMCISIYSFFPLFSLKPGLVKLFSGVSSCTGPAIIVAGLILYAASRLPGNKRDAGIVFLSGIVTAVIVYAGAMGAFAMFDVTDMSKALGTLQREGVPIAHEGKYNDMFNYLGRLEKPVAELNQIQVVPWAQDHPQGRIVAEDENNPVFKGIRPEHEYNFGLKTLKVWTCSSILSAHRKAVTAGPPKS